MKTMISALGIGQDEGIVLCSIVSAGVDHKAVRDIGFTQEDVETLVALLNGGAPDIEGMIKRAQASANGNYVAKILRKAQATLASQQKPR